MTLYIMRRLLWTLLVVAIVLLITFVVFYLLPAGDPAVRFAGKNPRPEQLELIRQRLGLDDPWYVRFGYFLKNFVTGDAGGWPGLGFTYAGGGSTPVRDLIIERAPRTLWLIAGAATLWLTSGVLIGIISAIKRRTVIDRAAMGFALFGISTPVFWLGLMMLY